MILKKQILNLLLDKAVVKIVPSRIAGAGVGVIALNSIDKDEIVFSPDTNCFISWQEVSSCSDEVLKHIKDVCHTNEFGFWIDCELNKINASYFVNHSESPNLRHDVETDTYYALRNIDVGEELTCKYLPEEITWT
jgi:SET domain-containing protein